MSSLSPKTYEPILLLSLLPISLLVYGTVESVRQGDNLNGPDLTTGSFKAVSDYKIRGQGEVKLEKDLFPC